MKWLERLLCGLAGHVPSTLLSMNSAEVFCLHCGKDLT